MFFLGQIGLGWVRGQSKVALKKKGALFGHSSTEYSGGGIPAACVHDGVKRLQMRHHS